MEKVKQTIAKLLIVFVIFCIGFSFGKHHKIAVPETPVKDVSSEASQKKFPVNVFYMHGTFRCESCNRIEKMAKTMLDEKFPEKLASGDIVWKEVNFQQRQDLAKKFEVVASCIVVEKTDQSGKSIFERLDKVWTLFEDKKAFDLYLMNSVNRILAIN